MTNAKSSEQRLPSPLEDITVLDLTVALAGPVATLLLGGLGARVIKIENPIDGDPCRSNPPYIGADGVSLSRTRPDDISLSAVNRLRNKLGVTLNLKHEKGREVFADLARKADMVVQNFSPGVLERLGIGYESVRKINPRIIYCSISGFGSDAGAGPTKALDTTIQALSGIMNVSGEEGEPPVRLGLPIADLSVALFGVIGILAALHQAQRTRRRAARGCFDAGIAHFAGRQRALRCLGTVRSCCPYRAILSAPRAFRCLSQQGRICRDRRLH